MKIFVLNAGSSSVKAAYFVADAAGRISPDPTWRGELRTAAPPGDGILRWSTAGDSGTSRVEGADSSTAVTALVRAARGAVTLDPDIVAHRIVHGMDESGCAPIDARVRAKIEAGAELAPLHNRAALAGIDAIATLFAGVPQAADFDTAFHRTLPDAVAAFALPYAWFARDGLRRYGFHGISHRYCAQRTAELLNADPAGLRVVTAHLGNGCSLAAVAGGKSVDTTMGFTPLDGLMMGTRSGSVDPGLLLYLLERGTYTAADLDRILNAESGLAGVSGVSGDMRDVIAAAESGNAQARLALDMYVRRLAAGIAAMVTALGGVDALAFTGGVGEHAGTIRERVCASLAFMGIALAADANAAVPDREIGATRAPVRVVLVAAREEYAIARDVARLPAAAPA